MPSEFWISQQKKYICDISTKMGNVESTSENMYDFEGSKFPDGDMIEGHVSYNRFLQGCIIDANCFL